VDCYSRSPATGVREELLPRKDVFAGMKVLVVDDALMVRKLLGRVLTAKGCVCEMAEDGLESVKAVEKKLLQGEPPYDIILMDFVMPM
jgi:two-component system, sensor histidine kinase and response regulator